MGNMIYLKGSVTDIIEWEENVFLDNIYREYNLRKETNKDNIYYISKKKERKKKQWIIHTYPYNYGQLYTINKFTDILLILTCIYDI